MLSKEWWSRNRSALFTAFPILGILLCLIAFFAVEKCSVYSAAIVPLWQFLTGLVSGAWLGLEWPHAAVIILSVFIYKFNDEARSLISRVHELGPGGFKFARGPVSPSSIQEIDDSLADAQMGATSSQPASGGVPLPPIYFPTQQAVCIATIDGELRMVDEANRTTYLKERLAFSRVHGNFEFIYGSAFGGQLAFLRLLNENSFQGVSHEQVSQEWEGHKARFKPAFDNWTKDQYLNFLVYNCLIEPSASGGIIITVKGREFLAWLTALGRSLDKPW